MRLTMPSAWTPGGNRGVSIRRCSSGIGELFSNEWVICLFKRYRLFLRPLRFLQGMIRLLSWSEDGAKALPVQEVINELLTSGQANGPAPACVCR